jgi:hypothetical protein
MEATMLDHRPQLGAAALDAAPAREQDETWDGEGARQRSLGLLRREAGPVQRKRASGLDAALEASARGADPGGGETAAAAEEDAAPAAPEPTDAEREAEPGHEAGALEVALPADLRADMEARTGVDLSAVRVQVSPEAEALGALAFTRGDTIVVRPDAWAPDTAEGRQLLIHELSHVVQQRQGRVAAGPGGINDDTALEAEADAGGPSRLAGGDDARESAEAEGPATAPVQRKVDPAAPVQRRVTVNRVAATHHDAATLRGQSLGDLLSHTRAQLDWSRDLTDAEAEPLRQLLARVSRTPAIANGCSDVPVSELLALSAADWIPVEKYSRAVDSPRSPATARLDRVATLAEARQLGEAVVKLEAAVGGVCLYTIATHASIKNLIDRSQVDDFVSYVTACQPILHAHGGRELTSFSLTRDVVDPVALKPRLPQVRSLHRFEGPALTKLAADHSDTAKTRPVTLILHTALDHNGAFHHDENLTRVIVNPGFLALMIEGAASLDAISGELDGLARTYGPGDRIAQAMIAGHGGPRAMDLAGTVSPRAAGAPGGEPRMVESGEAIDLDGNAEASDRLLDAILRNLDTSASGRVLLNACLTGSTDIQIDPASPDAPADQIRETLRDRPNLAEHLRRRAADQGIAADVRGANGSFGAEAELSDAAGRLDLVSPDDPALTGPKIDYVEVGREPEGVMRAVLETWEDPTGAATKPEWLVRVERRIAAGPSDWETAIIHSFFGLIESRYAASPSMIQSFIPLAHPLSALFHQDEARVWKVADLQRHPAALTILSDLAASPSFGGLARLVLLQIWLKLDASKRDDLLAVLGGRTVSNSELHVDTDHLGNADLTAMLTPTDTPLPGQLVLACIDRLTSPHPASERFLLRLLGTGDEFPAALGLPALLGNRSVDAVLETLGRGPRAAAGAPRRGARTEDGNLDLDGDGVNETYADPVQRPGLVANCYVLRVRKQPSMSADTIDFLRTGDPVFVVGHLRGWDVIDHQGTIAFVGSSFIER